MEYEFSSENFGTEVLQSELPVLVDFFADWCAPCKMMAPALEELAKQYEGRLKVGKLDIGAHQQTAEQYKVRNIPTFLFFKNGEVVDKLVGADKKELEKKCSVITG